MGASCSFRISLPERLSLVPYKVLFEYYMKGYLGCWFKSGSRCSPAFLKAGPGLGLSIVALSPPDASTIPPHLFRICGLIPTAQASDRQIVETRGVSNGGVVSEVKALPQ